MSGCGGEPHFNSGGATREGEAAPRPTSLQQLPCCAAGLANAIDSPRYDKLDHVKIRGARPTGQSFRDSFRNVRTPPQFRVSRGQQGSLESSFVECERSAIANGGSWYRCRDVVKETLRRPGRRPPRPARARGLYIRGRVDIPYIHSRGIVLVSAIVHRIGVHRLRRAAAGARMQSCKDS